MQLEIQLIPPKPVRLPFSYQHALAGAVYAAMTAGNNLLAADVHDGAQKRNRIKMFSLFIEI
jgi:CRISPR/Cas system endoribonuclease Cas6 (RAMP superfamily)